MSEIRDIHEPFMRYLREHGVEFTRARSDRESTIEVGWPDFSLHHPSFPSIFLEMKVDKKPLTAAQKRVHARLIGKGHVVHVCRDIASAVKIVEAWLGGVIFKSPTATNVAPTENLRIHAGWVWKKSADSCNRLGWFQLRKATPADAQLAKLL